MPVEDHPVHPSTVGSERYGACQTKQRQPGYFAHDTTYHGRAPMRTLRWIEDRSTVACRYDMRADDPKCEGCPQKAFADEYDEKLRSMTR